MSDDKKEKKEPVPGSKKPDGDQKKSDTETESDDEKKKSDDKEQDSKRTKPLSDQSKPELQKTQPFKAEPSKPELAKPEVPKPSRGSESPQSPTGKVSKYGPVLLRRPSREPGAQPPAGGKDPTSRQSGKKKWWQCYDKDKTTFCGRTWGSWMYIIVYSIMYLIFLSTYTLIFLYTSLVIIKANDVYLEKTSALMFFKSGIGLTATPTTESSSPMIWYHKRHAHEYKKYVDALERLVNQRRKGNVTKYEYLGPCGTAPFGYGDAPCVIVRINKHWGWKARPLRAGVSADVPSSVQQWAQKDAKLWLSCDGHHPYDSDHIGTIKYYPDPPGFDPAVFPLARDSESPLIAVQFSNFTLGMSIVVECKLWYEDGTSSVSFVLYVGT